MAETEDKARALAHYGQLAAQAAGGLVIEHHWYSAAKVYRDVPVTIWASYDEDDGHTLQAMLVAGGVEITPILTSEQVRDIECEWLPGLHAEARADAREDAIEFWSVAL